MKKQKKKPRFRRKNHYYILIESSVIKDLRTIHKTAISSLHRLLGATVKIVYVDGVIGIVKATISDDKLDAYLNDQFVNRNIVNFHILKQSLIDEDLAIKGFKTVEYNREKYQVEDVTDTSVMGTTYTLRCSKVG